MKELTKKLKLLSIEANNWTHDDEGREIVTCNALHFEFYGEQGFSAFVTDDALKGEFPSFQMIESDDAVLHESFSDQLREHWVVIVDECNKFNKQHFKDECEMLGIYS